MAQDLADLHPFDLHTRREPVADAAIDVVVEPGNPEIGASIAAILRSLGRDPRVCGPGEGTSPLVLDAPAVEGWTAGHVAPLLKAIDRADHVVGRRPGRSAWPMLPWRFLLAVSIVDVHSPCRIHRRGCFEAIPIQSTSDFADVERLAKATFLGHLVDEVDVPELPSVRRKRGRRRDLSTVFRHPTFVHPSVPAEDPQGEGERADGPGGEDAQSDDHTPIGQPGPLQQDHPQGGDELGQR